MPNGPLFLDLYSHVRSSGEEARLGMKFVVDIVNYGIVD